MMSRPALAIAAFILAASGQSALAASPAMGETTASIGPAVIQIQDGDLPLAFETGSIKGELTATPVKGPYTAGSSAFAQVRLSSEGGGKSGLSAELILEAEHGEIASVKGIGVKGERKGKTGYVALIDGIKKDQSRAVLIEVRLRADESRNPNRLILTLRAPGGQALPDEAAAQDGAPPVKTVALAWPVADCATAYHAALLKIGENGGNDLRQVWKDASRPDQSLSRGWMFRPSAPGRSGRKEKESQAAGLSAKEIRSIYGAAERLSRAGHDRSLTERGEHGWMLSKVAGDLRQYFTQDNKPSICTGAVGFTEYYAKRLAPVGELRISLASLAGKAEQLAREKAAEVLKAAREAQGGHPAWGGAKLASLKPVATGEGDIKTVLTGLLEAAGYPAAALEGVKAAGSAYDAIRELDRAGLKLASIPDAAEDELRQAVAAFEAAARLAIFHGRQERLWQSFDGSLEAIRAAHREHCVCGS